MANGEIDLMRLAAGPRIEETTFQLWPGWFKKAGLEGAPDLDLPHPLSELLAI